MKNVTKVLSEMGIKGKLHAGPGGVGIYESRFPISEYEMLRQKLTDKFGEAKIQEPWYCQHTKTRPPLTFYFPEREYVDHVNLISMMQQKKKQYCMVSWMI